MDDAEEQIPVMLQRARSNLGDVVLQMPFAAKAAYVAALSRCPHLVETESNPNQFLLFEKFNYWSAAGRLVTYWRKRLEYFGDRAFLPMDLSGQGAMNDEDIKPFAAGYFTMFPNSNIFVFDQTCSSKNNTDDAAKLRRRFFFLQMLMGPGMRCEKAPRIFIYGFEISDMRRRMNAQMKALIKDAFPLPNFEELHVIFIKEKSQTLWQSILPVGLEQMSGLFADLKIHNFDSVEQIAEGLACYGVSRNHIPVQLGGSYNMELSPFVLECGLPLSKVDELKSGNSLSSSQFISQQQNAAGKGSLEHLLDYFMRRAPDLPDVAETDSLDPLKPFASIFPNRQTTNNDTRLYPDGLVTNPTSQSCDTMFWSHSVPMYLQSDADILSAYQCQVRQQIEFFQASDDDVTSTVRGRNKAIVLGQVGIRCRHCAHLPRQKRPMGATYYPTRLSGIYQTSQNFARKHLIDCCPFVPAECRQRLVDICASKSPTGTGKKYWAEAAQICGVVEDDGILRFQKK